MSKYTIVLKSPMGPKEGIISLSELNSHIQASFDMLGKKFLMDGTLSESGKLSLEGVFDMPLGEEHIEVIALLKGNILTGKFKRKNDDYEITGMKLD
ncbi:MAG: hypothetical protein ACI4LO_06205 [Anaerovoracaceae bacterium]